MKRLEPNCVDNEVRVGIGYRMLNPACIWEVSIDSRAVREPRHVRQTSLVKKSENAVRAQDPLCDFWVTADSFRRGETDRA
jgi:hypothetical protein